MKVFEMVLGGDLDAAIVLGGDNACVTEWPLNPDGEPLLLVASIDCGKLQLKFPHRQLPSGTVYVFSSYSKSEYFLENITYSGDPAELDAIKSGYTMVSASVLGERIKAPASFIPPAAMGLREKDVDADSFPVFSLVADKPPKGFKMAAGVLDEFEFCCQFYSGDFPSGFEDVFYLADAVGYVFLSRSPSESEVSGLFFVQTA